MNNALTEKIENSRVLEENDYIFIDNGNGNINEYFRKTNEKLFQDMKDILNFRRYYLKLGSQSP